jgi:DNA-binding winged helix-turn-helix (wHTH) protein/predicted ATPase
MRAAKYYLFAPFSLDPVNQQLWRGEKEIPLRRKPFEVLCYLVARPGELVTKAALLDAVWADVTVSDSMPAMCVGQLRKALGDEHGIPRFIATVHGRGYRFIARVTTTPSLEPRPKPHSIPSTPAPIMVGRDAEMAQLRNWFARVLQGQRRIVFVAGEPGIGKTTFVRAFLDSLGHEDGVQIGCGQCIEQYGAGEPYMPVLEALTRLGQEGGNERLLEALHRFAPSWLAQMPFLLSEAEREKLSGTAQAVTQQRMLREMAQALEALAADSPLVLFLEDLHWSDSSTLELISTLARRGESARLLVIGTYRPVEMPTSDHPLRTVKGELELHRLCDELRLALLSKEDVEKYLAMRLSGRPGEGLVGLLSAALHEHTDGNPLFMVSVVDDLAQRGMLNTVGESTSSEFADLFRACEVETPRGILQMIARNLERLDCNDQAVLKAASVVGVDFSAAAVAAALARSVTEIEDCCARLSYREQFVRTQGTSEWPDGTVAEIFRFTHSLYAEVLYGGIPGGSRVELHRRIAEREEHAYGERTAEVASELAHHFSRANEKNKAVRYFELAGQQALQRSAHVDAISSLNAAIDLLQSLPDSPARIKREMFLQRALGSAFIEVKGPAAPEVERAYTRARELLGRLGDDPLELLPALIGLCLTYLAQGELQMAREQAAHLLRRAESEHDPTLLLCAHNALGATLLQMGELLLAREHLEMAIPLLDSKRPLSVPYTGVSLDAGACCLSNTAQTLWYLGYPDQALKRGNEALVLAQGLSHPHSLVFVEDSLGYLHLCRGEARAARETAERVIELSNEHGFAYWLAHATCLRGFALTEQGHKEEGVAQTQKGLAAYRATGSELGRSYLLNGLAKGYMETGRLNDGLNALAEAAAAADKHDDRFAAAETHRLNGELLLQLGHSRSAEAQNCFQLAIEIAQKQRAKAWELRATTSLARLLNRTGRRAEALAILAEIYSWFTEGFETADLKEAKALLDKLATEPGTLTDHSDDAQRVEELLRIHARRAPKSRRQMNRIVRKN